MLLYDIGILTYASAIKIASLKVKKAKQWCDGRKDLFERIQRAVSPSDRVVWIHVASLGEFEQGRPLIEKIRATHPEYKILITFFSPSGYEIRKSYEGADYIFYLPIDTSSNAKQFLDIVNPEIAIFVKYEYWLNLLFELRRRNIRSYIVSAIFRPNSVFFKWWGGMWRSALNSFCVIFVQDQNSKELLNNRGFNDVVVAGDTRFDRVASLSKSVAKIASIESFCGDSFVLVAGSTWQPDEQALLTLADRHPDVKIIIAPHEIDEEHLSQIESLFCGRSVRFTEFDAALKGSNVNASTQNNVDTLKERQILILNTMGMLSSLYQYGSVAYIGGGFGVGIHNTLEAATFGLPIAFGPNYKRFKEAVDMIELDICRPIDSADELDRWFSEIKNNEALRLKRGQAASDYTSKMCGATEIITKHIFER